jgi:hypothetical protein
MGAITRRNNQFMAKKQKRKKKCWVLGVGLDNKDGHTRITTGENFKLIGGSDETHGMMQEKALKMNEHLKRRGKKLEDLSKEEFHEIADKVGMPLLEKPVHRKN